MGRIARSIVVERRALGEERAAGLGTGVAKPSGGTINNTSLRLVN
jgi:hypothetical protein